MSRTTEARVVLEQWRKGYNTLRPHSSLGAKPRRPSRPNFWRTRGLRRLKDLERENRPLKQLVADLALDREILKDALSKML